MVVARITLYQLTLITRINLTADKNGSQTYNLHGHSDGQLLAERTNRQGLADDPLKNITPSTNQKKKEERKKTFHPTEILPDEPRQQEKSPQISKFHPWLKPAAHRCGDPMHVDFT